jgi:hypothetical protein
MPKSVVHWGDLPADVQSEIVGHLNDQSQYRVSAVSRNGRNVASSAIDTLHIDCKKVGLDLMRNPSRDIDTAPVYTRLMSKYPRATRVVLHNAYLDAENTKKYSYLASITEDLVESLPKRMADLTIVYDGKFDNATVHWDLFLTLMNIPHVQSLCVDFRKSPLSSHVKATLGPLGPDFQLKKLSVLGHAEVGCNKDSEFYKHVATKGQTGLKSVVVNVTRYHRNMIDFIRSSNDTLEELELSTGMWNVGFMKRLTGAARLPALKALTVEGDAHPPRDPGALQGHVTPTLSWIKRFPELTRVTLRRVVIGRIAYEGPPNGPLRKLVLEDCVVLKGSHSQDVAELERRLPKLDVVIS